MSGDFVWAIKNGDLEQVKDIIEKKVRNQNILLLLSKQHNNSLIYSLLM